MSRLLRIRPGLWRSGGLSRHRSRGQALVEFAIVFPIFMVVLFGLIDVGRYVYVANALNQASREGARFGSVEQWQFSCPASVASKDRFTCTEAATLRSLAGTPANVTATVTCESVGAGGVTSGVTAARCGSNDLLLVQVTAPNYQFFTPVIGQILGTPTISGRSQTAVQ